MKKVIDIISIMPEFFDSFLSTGLINRAIKENIIEINIINPRTFSNDKHKRVDSGVYGGGAGQLLMAEPILKAWEHANFNYNSKHCQNKTCNENETYKTLSNDAAANNTNINNTNNNDAPLSAQIGTGGQLSSSSNRGQREQIENIRPAEQSVIMSASGKLLNASLAKSLADNDHLIIICGRYEGIDARVNELTNSIEISIGDYILSGGEIASIVFIEAVSRFYKHFLGNEDSLKEESFSGDCYNNYNNIDEKLLLEYPQYTKPRELYGLKVPEVLLNGNHELIRQWRLKNAISKTILNRPELVKT
jgi:tRNA (guanine37-N1)-methyltransferase